MLFNKPIDFIKCLLSFQNLKTDKIGRLVIYTPVMGSSMHVFNNLTLEHGLAVIPRKQTNGNGRHKNTVGISNYSHFKSNCKSLSFKFSSGSVLMDV